LHSPLRSLYAETRRYYCARLHQISFVGILSNIIVVPFVGMVVVPLGLLSGILSLATHHLPLADLNQSVADAFIAVVAFFADLPFAEVHPPSPHLLWLLFSAIFFYSLFEAVRTRLLFLFKPFENRPGSHDLLSWGWPSEALPFSSSPYIPPFREEGRRSLFLTSARETARS
jgi:Competence protein